MSGSWKVSGFQSARNHFLVLVFLVVSGFFFHGRSMGSELDLPVVETHSSFPPPSLARHFLVSHGILFGPLMLVLDLALLGLAIRLTLQLRTGYQVPPGLLQAARKAADQGVDPLLALGGSDHSLLGLMLTAGLGRLGQGLEEARYVLRETARRFQVEQERLLRYLVLIAVLGPLLGLLGTLFGTILFTMQLSISDASSNANALASGISHALVVVLHGAMQAIAAVLLWAFFKNRLEQIQLTAWSHVDGLLTKLHDSGQVESGKTNQGK